MAEAKQETLAQNISDVNEADWETVVEESGAPIPFENVGDQFVGQLLGSEMIEPEGWKEEDHFKQWKFRDTEGNVRVLNGGYKLNEALEIISKDSLVRVTRVADVPMNDPGKNPMKDYRIEVAKA